MTDIVKMENRTQDVSVFSNGESFEHAQRIAKMLCSSDLVPSSYRGNMANTLVALEMAHRLRDSPLMVMQNMNVIHGKPSWGSSYIIAKINACGRFSALKFRLSGTGDDRGCVAYTTELATGDVIEGPPVTIGMAKKEGWYTKSGSKWPTMPDLMLQYRSAAFFGRLNTPELLMGMQTTEELYDVNGGPRSNQEQAPPAIDELNVQASSEPVVISKKQTTRTRKDPAPLATEATVVESTPVPPPEDEELI